MIVFVTLALLVLGYIQNGLPQLGVALKIIACVIFLAVVSLLSRKATYLQIDNGILFNKAYRSFGHDEILISRIKYIYRIPATIFTWAGPSTMLIYSRRHDGVITHSKVREAAFDQETIKSFLLRIKDLNPHIELDPEYEEVISGTRKLSRPTKNSVHSVEQRLRDKGEKW